jgi:hypothetical protein
MTKNEKKTRVASTEIQEEEEKTTNRERMKAANEYGRDSRAIQMVSNTIVSEG